MIRKHSFFSVLLMLFCSIVFGQDSIQKNEYQWAFTTNAGANSFAGSVAWSHYHGIGRQRRLRIGYGLRLTSFWGSDLEYITAPAKYTSGRQSFAALFAENINANIDTVHFPGAQVNALNAGIYLSYVLPYWKNRFTAGINIDAVGFSFGSSRQATYKNNTVFAKPSAFNLLLISDSDKGSLNSEWYVSYRAGRKVSLKAGYEFLFTEFTTSSKIQPIPAASEFNDRFRLKSGMVMLGVLYSPTKK
jgi:hypothetical protein